MNYVEEFKSYLVFVKNLSNNTAENYGRDVEQFLKFTKKKLKDITYTDVLKFIGYLRKQGNTTATTNRKLSAIKKFFKVMIQLGMLKSSPAEAVESGKLEKRLPKPIDHGDLDKLFEAAESLREKVILEVLYGSGVRREELIKIHINDVNFENGSIRIIGKGNKERIVPIHPEGMKLIRKLFMTHGSEWLFPSRKGGGKNHISKRQVNTIIENIVKRAGLKGITPHSFRHSFCTHLYQNGVELKVIADLVGHESTNTTSIYTKIDNVRNQTEYLRAHPRATKTGS